METARVPSLWEDAQNCVRSCAYAAEEMRTTGVGSGNTTLILAAHTAGDTPQFTPRKFHSSERSFFFIVMSFASDGWERPCGKGRNEWRRARESLSVISAGKGLAQKQSQHQSDHTQITSHSRTTVGCNSWWRLCAETSEQWCPKEEAERTEFVDFSNSNSFVLWTMNFKSEGCSSSSLPTKATVAVNEIDSAKNMKELKSSGSLLGRMVQAFEVLDSKITSALRRLLTTDFIGRVSMEEQKGTPGQSITERKTNRLHCL